MTLSLSLFSMIEKHVLVTDLMINILNCIMIGFLSTTAILSHIYLYTLLARLSGVASDTYRYPLGGINMNAGRDVMAEEKNKVQNATYCIII